MALLSVVGGNFRVVLSVKEQQKMEWKPNSKKYMTCDGSSFIFHDCDRTGAREVKLPEKCDREGVRVISGAAKEDWPHFKQASHSNGDGTDYDALIDGWRYAFPEGDHFIPSRVEVIPQKRKTKAEQQLPLLLPAPSPALTMEDFELAVERVNLYKSQKGDKLALSVMRDGSLDFVMGSGR